MLRAVGAILLLAGSAGLGLAAVRRLERRVTTLRSLTEALELMERELDFCLPPMKELILETAQRSTTPASEFLRACGEGMDELEGKPLSGLWQQAAVEKLTALKHCDLETVFSIGAVLGRYDGEGQRRAIAAARERLADFLSGAVEERRRQGRVYGALGITAGAFLVILLL